MNKKEICIIIPIYKKHLNDFEIKSIEQCVKVLSDYSIYFVTHKSLNLDFYRKNFPEMKEIFFFDENYFKSIKGYNKLMLSPVFYKAFESYQYMLIYQTDCYVFKDELLTWAEKGFDYIGGVWFDEYLGDPNLGAQLWHPGNGGLSLRKTKSIHELLTSKHPIKGFRELLEEMNKIKKTDTIKFIKNLLLLPLNVFGYKNNYSYYASNFSHNEDVYFMEASLIYKKLKTPTVKEAIGFSWDRKPKFLWEVFGDFPFACHAWFRNDSHYVGNKEFWLNKILNL